MILFLMWLRKCSKLEINKLISVDSKFYLGFLGGASGKEPAYQYRRHKKCGFDP